MDLKLMKKVTRAHSAGDRKPIRTWSRASTVLPQMVGLTMAIHDGRRFVPILIVENMIGHKLGEFVPTRTFRGHTSKSNRNAGND